MSLYSNVRISFSISSRILRLFHEHSPMNRVFLIKFDDLIYTKNDAIGEGTFGTVYKGELYGQTVAIKTMRVLKINEDALKEFQDEVTASCMRTRFLSKIRYILHSLGFMLVGGLNWFCCIP